VTPFISAVKSEVRSRQKEDWNRTSRCQIFSYGSAG